MGRKRATVATARNTKKRALSPEKSVTEHDSDASVNPSNEKPAKRPRTSTTIPTGSEEVGSSVTSTAIVVKEKDTSTAVLSSNSGTEDANQDTLMLGGTFDLYGMALPSLNEVYSPSGSPTVFPENLYNEILTYRTKNDRTAKFTVPEDFSTAGKYGQFWSGIFLDPIEESPFDVIVTGIRQIKKLKVKSEYGRPADAWNGPGLKARMKINGGQCGISSSGNISMHPLWRKVNKDGKVMELFEGTFTFKVTYSAWTGYGRGPSQTLAFWGIRAKA